MKRKALSYLITLVLTATGLIAATLADLPAASAATNPNCAANGPDPSLGTDFVTYSIPTSGTYTIWTRMMADVAADNSYYLQIDCGNPITVGGASLTAGAWSWVDYQNGSTSSVITANLTAGSHTFNLTGKSPNLIVDRIVFSTVSSCVPTGTGDNCAIPPSSPTPTVAPTSTPTPTPTTNPTHTPTPTPTPTVSGTPSPTGIPGDVNGDGKVNVVDLSLLLSHWGTNYPPAEFDHTNVVDIVDLSLLLSHWTG